MPVVVTGTDHPLGSAVVRALVAQLGAGGGQVRATVRDRAAAPAVRALGVPVAVTDLSDPLTTGAVLEDAHTVVHLQDPLATWTWLLEAAEGTTVRRVVVVLPVGTSPLLAPPPALALEVVVVPGDPLVEDSAVVQAVLAADARR